MRSFLLPLMMAFAPLAEATTYGPYSTPAWPIISSEPAAVSGAQFTGYGPGTISDWEIEACKPGTWPGHSTCPHQGETAEWASSWSSVKCYTWWNADEGRQWYGMRFYGIHGSWPSSWPSSVTCSRTEGSDSVSTTVPLTTRADSDGEGDAPLTLSNFTTTVTVTLSGEEGSDWVPLKLPAGTYTSNANPINCTKTGGGTWDEVFVQTVEVGSGSGGVDRAMIWGKWKDATRPVTYTGTCPIVQGGVTKNLPVQLVEN